MGSQHQQAMQRLTSEQQQQLNGLISPLQGLSTQMTEMIGAAPGPPTDTMSAAPPNISATNREAKALETGGSI
eukprot:11611728-Karenia_brevis.AAC.1